MILCPGTLWVLRCRAAGMIGGWNLHRCVLFSGRTFVGGKRAGERTLRVEHRGNNRQNREHLSETPQHLIPS